MWVTEKNVVSFLWLVGIAHNVGAHGQGIVSQNSNVLAIKDLEKDGWEMIFRGTSSNGDSVYHAWTLGQNTSPDKPATMERTHGLHFRDPIINNWSNLGIEFVKFAFYDEDKEVAYVLFHGNNSDLSNWFDKSRVIKSSWPDLNSAETYNFFSIVGHYIATRHDRRFFINKSYANCPNDLGHMAVINSKTPAICLWDNHATYPQFIYSKINSIDFWERRMFGTADYMAIFIKKRL